MLDLRSPARGCGGTDTPTRKSFTLWLKRGFRSSAPKSGEQFIYVSIDQIKMRSKLALMSNADGLLAALLNLLSLGAGYAYCGRMIQAALTLLFSLALFFLLSYLAAYSPWFLVGGSALAVLAVV